MYHTQEIIALCAALDADSRAYWLALGRRMLAKCERKKRPVLTLLPFSGNPRKELLSDGIESQESEPVAELLGKPVSR